jgi:hypothetical protein
MPFVSKAQQGYFNANKAKLEKQGVNVQEWNDASKGMKLPEHASKKQDDVTQMRRPLK